MNFAKGFRGGERQTLLLVEALEKRGYHQKVITRANSELADRLERIKNLHIIRISKPYFFHLNTVKDVDLLHAHETKAAQFAYLAKLTFGISYFITRRVDIPIGNNFFNRGIYKNAKSIIVLSRAIKKQIVKITDNNNIRRIPSACSELTINSNEVEKIKNRFASKFIIGNIGALEYSKGQNFLIEAVKQLSAKYPQIHLVFLGKGRDEDDYKKLADGMDNITFEGFVNNVGDYISCFDLFVFPSLHEGFGSILLDVMQQNIPVIASNTGGIPDIITHNKNGLLIKTKSSQDIYNAIERLYLNRKLAEKLAADAAKDMGTYKPAVMADRYENLYGN